MTRRPNRRATLLLALGIALGVAAGGARVAEAQDQPVIRVAVSAFEAQADAYYAQDLGLYKKAGLNIDIRQYQGGEAIVAGIVGGALEIGAGTTIPLANAHEHGLDVVLIAPGTITDAAALPPTSGLIVQTNSPIQTGADLNGKTVAVNTLHSVDQIATEMWVDKNGGNSKSLKFVELPNLSMVEATAGGRVDAAVIADPGFTSGITGGRVRRLADVNEAIAKRFMISAFFSSRAWADRNPDAARKFAAAINEAAAWAVKNPEAAAVVLNKYLRLTTTRAHERHARTMDPALIQPLIDAAVRYGRLAQPLDVRQIIWR